MKHSVNVIYAGHTFGNLPKLARAIADLRYDALGEFLHELTNCIYTDCVNDRKAKKRNLAACLEDTSANLLDAEMCIKDAWAICEPHMKDK